MKFRAENRSEILLALALVVFGAALRLLPHPDNFTPVAALSLFAGLTLPAGLALTVPLLIVAVTDLLIGPHDLVAFTWGSFALVAFLGNRLQRVDRVGVVVFGSILGSVIFFLVTNLAVFFFGRLYPLSWSGLVQCYAMAVPFFRGTFAGDLFYSAVLFGIFATARLALRKDCPA